MKNLLYIVPLIILALAVFIYFTNKCEISGKAILWAYDSCFWQYETDDSIHPGVIKCVEEAEIFMKKVKACEAKRTFKSRICKLAKEQNLEDPDPKTCMEIDKPLGSAVRDGGI